MVMKTQDTRQTRAETYHGGYCIRGICEIALRCIVLSKKCRQFVQ